MQRRLRSGEYAERLVVCETACLPCGFNNAQWCLGGEQIALDGNPLFFPIDDAPGILTDTRGAAAIPAQVYMGLGLAVGSWRHR